jgi:hypothetical protein
MRRVLLTALAATVAVAALAAGTAGAQTVTKFSVIEKVKSGKRTDCCFVTTGVLLSPTTGAKVGTDEVKFNRTHPHVGGVAFFPDGKLKIAGDLRHQKVPVVGGTRRWNGASGKLKFEPLTNRKTLLTFTVVQG